MKKDPKQEYTLQLEGLRAAEARNRSLDRSFVIAKLSLVVLTVIAGAWLVRSDPRRLAWLLISVVIFALLIHYHERVLRALRLASRLITHYERGLARLRGEWMGKGNRGEQFLDSAHPYSRDLDIFGEGSLFELICQARTRAGEQTLAAWLLAGAAPEEIRARQDAVRDLEERLIFREVLATAGEDARTGVRPDALIAWGEPAPAWNFLRFRILLLLLGAIWLFCFLSWLVNAINSTLGIAGSLGADMGWCALVMTALNFGISYKLRSTIDGDVAGMEAAGHDLEILSGVLGGIEAERFSSAKLLTLQSKLKTHGVPPSQAIRQLRRKVDWLLSRDNWFVRLLDPVLFWTPQCLFAIERWRIAYGRSIRNWLSSVGEVEALASLASYAFEHAADVMPVFVEKGPYLEATSFAHPLLVRKEAVTNDIKLEIDGLQMMMVSGPNMAGKSTFLRGLGVNVVLAQAGAPVRAERMVLSSLVATASICVLDSLQGGLSRFYVEIKRLKQIADMSSEGLPVLFLFDELLSGTNSHDRRVGTESVLRNLLANGAIGLVTTHDLALTEIVESMEGRAANFHFSDQFEEGELHFDYKLYPGVVQTTNALTLMRSIGIKI
jgi:ABC-type multidrug transport system fused ATPase/permease subunit